MVDVPIYYMFHITKNKMVLIWERRQTQRRKKRERDTINQKPHRRGLAIGLMKFDVSLFYYFFSLHRDQKTPPGNRTGG